MKRLTNSLGILLCIGLIAFTSCAFPDSSLSAGHSLNPFPAFGSSPSRTVRSTARSETEEEASPLVTHFIFPSDVDDMASLLNVTIYGEEVTGAMKMDAEGVRTFTYDFGGDDHLSIQDGWVEVVIDENGACSYRQYVLTKSDSIYLIIETDEGQISLNGSESGSYFAMGEVREGRLIVNESGSISLDKDYFKKDRFLIHGSATGIEGFPALTQGLINTTDALTIAEGTPLSDLTIDALVENWDMIKELLWEYPFK